MAEETQVSKGIPWGEFDVERYPRLNDELKDVGSKQVVVGVDDGRKVDAKILAEALKKKGEKSVKPRDSFVFLVENAKKEKREFWTSAESYTLLQQLAKIRRENNNTLVGAKFEVERVSANDPSKPAFKVN